MRCRREGELLCNFSRNFAGGNGGAQSFDELCQVKINGTKYVDNYAGNDGGGIFLSQSCTLDVSDSHLGRNSGNGDSSRGGAIYWDEGGTVTISYSFIIGNESVFGGGLYWYGVDSNVGVYDCIVRDNIAKGHGGGLYWSNGAPKIKGSIISENISEGQYVSAPSGQIYGGGGGIFCWSSSERRGRRPETRAPPLRIQNNCDIVIIGVVL